MAVKWWKYKDTDILNKIQYEEAIEIQDLMESKKYISKYHNKLFKRHLLINIHKRALMDNIKIDSIKSRLNRGTSLSILLERGLQDELNRLRGLYTGGEKNE